MFLDEKTFNLDGPDGLAYYWHDIRREKKLFSKRQKGGGGVMVWGAFNEHFTSELAILRGNQNSHDYIRTIEDFMLPFSQAESMMQTEFISRITQPYTRAR